MILIIVFIVAVIVGVIAPAWLGIVIFIADCFLPDPFPLVDEVGLAVAVISKIKNG